MHSALKAVKMCNAVVPNDLKQNKTAMSTRYDQSRGKKSSQRVHRQQYQINIRWMLDDGGTEQAAGYRLPVTFHLIGKGFPSAPCR